MKKEFINEELESLLEAISDQLMQIRSYNGTVPLIELDITLANIAKLYENLTHLKRINQKEVSLQPIMDSPPVVEKEMKPADFRLNETEQTQLPLPVDKPPIVSFVVSPAPVEAVNESRELKIEEPVAVKTDMPEARQEINPETAEVTAESWKEEIAAKPAEIFREETRKETVTKKSTVQSMGLFDSVPTVADQFEEQTTLRDKISKTQTDSSLGKKYQKKAVEDLKKSIGINEKFSFINELFEGDLGNYNKAIDTLNQSGNLEEAWNYLTGQLMPKYSWSQDNKSFLSLKELLERRFLR